MVDIHLFTQQNTFLDGCADDGCLGCAGGDAGQPCVCASVNVNVQVYPFPQDVRASGARRRGNDCARAPWPDERGRGRDLRPPAIEPQRS